MRLVDSHCHIHDEAFFHNNEQNVLYQRARGEGVYLIVVGTTESDSRNAVAFASTREGVSAVVGVHPHDARHGCEDIGNILAERSGSIVGIGEIGLDYFYDNSPRSKQIEALNRQLQWAQDYKLPVSFHVREAFDDFWPIFNNFSGIRGVLHSFTDTKETLNKALGKGLYIGVNGISTFTKQSDQKEMFSSIPLDRMLLETDAPFLTPKPYRGKVNEPAFVRFVAEFHASERQIGYEEVAQQTTTNARVLFTL